MATKVSRGPGAEGPQGRHRRTARHRRVAGQGAQRKSNRRRPAGGQSRGQSNRDSFERDVIRGMAQHGDMVTALPVERLMTIEVRTCSPDDAIVELMEVMTLQRIRHLPVRCAMERSRGSSVSATL